MLIARSRSSRAVGHGYILIAAAIAFGVSMFLLRQYFETFTDHLHPLASTTVIRASSAETRRQRQVSGLRDQKMHLQQKVDDLAKDLAALQQVGLPNTATTQSESTVTDRHTPWAPRADRDKASSNPELASVLRRLSINTEVAVAVSNKFLAADGYMLEGWCAVWLLMHHTNLQGTEAILVKYGSWTPLDTFGQASRCKNMQRAGVTNHLVVALDDETKAQVEKFGSTAVRVNLSGEEEQKALRTGSSHAVSVLLSDVDIVTIANPFDHLHRDSDVEGMSDGWDDAKAYGYNDVFDDPQMGWSRYSHSIRVSVVNSGLFYMRPTLASLDVLRLVFDRIKAEHGWDQALFNEVLFLPSRPGYVSPNATRRILDRYLFMNSKTLFVYLRKDAKLYAETHPVMVHVNYHNDKWRRFLAVEQRYVHGVMTALDTLSDSTV